MNIKIIAQKREFIITSRPMKGDNLEDFIEISVKDTGVGFRKEIIISS